MFGKGCAHCGGKKEHSPHCPIRPVPLKEN